MPVDLPSLPPRASPTIEPTRKSDNSKERLTHPAGPINRRHGRMPKTLRSPRQNRLAEIIAQRRLDAGLSQTELAKRLGRYQSVVAAIEGGGRRIDVVELLDLAD